MKESILVSLLILIMGCGNINEKRHNTYENLQWSMYRNDSYPKNSKINKYASINHKLDYYKYTGKNIKIVVIDDSLDVNHEDLKGAIVDTWDLTTKTSNVLPTLNEYHGTAVTGIIAARDNQIGIRGLAPKSKIFFLKHKHNMKSNDILELLNKAYSYNPDIINCSWGTYHVSKEVKTKIKEMATNGREGKGIVFVWAAGNNQKDIEGDESAISEVIAVGATNKDNELSYLNNYGEELDILAPGGDYQLGITTLDPMKKNGIGFIKDNYILADNAIPFDGTSAAAPIVTGIVAIMLELNYNLTRADIQKILKENTDKIGDEPYLNGHNSFYGYGKVNLSKIIDFIELE